jgi:RND superfamily putative drug exporter
MFTRLGTLTVRYRRFVLATTLVALIVAGIVGGAVFGRLSTGGFEDPDSESTRAEALLDEQFGTGSPDLVLVVSASAEQSASSARPPGDDPPVDDPSVTAAGLALTDSIAANDGVADVASYWSLGSPASLRSADGDRALLLLRVPGDEDDAERAELVDELITTYDDAEFAAANPDGVEPHPWSAAVTVEVGGPERIFTQVGETIEGDLARAESIAIPLTLLLLVIVFGGIVAALLPLAVGVVAVLGAFLTLFVITGFTDVSIFSINLVTAMGLGLAIDYSLFVVSRYREELARGRSVDDAVVRTVETAGRTVAFSALTVAVSLSALLIFPLYFLRSFAYAGVGVILVAMVASVVALPALLAVLGGRVDRWRVRTPRSAADGGGMWHGVASAVMRRPLTVAITGITLLVLAGLPFLRVEFGVPDDRVLPEEDPARAVSETLRTEFDSAESDAFSIVATGVPGEDAIERYAIEVSEVNGVARVDTATGRYADGGLVAPADASLAGHRVGDAARITVVPAVEPISPEAEAMIGEIRELDHDFDEVAVGGQSAALVDGKSAIFDLVPWAGLWIAVATFVLLFLMFGSLLVPLKAIVLNTLSLTATFGAMVWVFQDGHGSGILGFTPTGLTDTTTPILMFCIAFGLSMDYEVFLLSRMKEEYDRTGENDLAVATGLEKTGKLVTAAALLLSITFFAFATSGVTFIKLFGLGLGLAVLVDAFIVRATLVPALMKLAGSWNWWAPPTLRRLHDRIGISESVESVPVESAVDAQDDVGDHRELVDAGEIGHDR